MRRIASLAAWVLLLVPMGCGGSSGDGFAVVGTVVGIDGTPLELVVVRIDDRLVTATDRNGSFRVRGVRRPYDVTLIDTDGTSSVVFRGLRRRDPVLPLLQDRANRSGRLEGSFSGGAGFPPPSGTFTALYVRGPGELSMNLSHDPNTGIYGTQPFDTIEWAGGVLNPAVLHVVQYASGPTGITGFSGYARAPLILQESSTTIENVVLQPVGVFVVAGNYTVPSGLAFDSARIAVESSGSEFRLPPGAATGGAYGLVAPTVPGASFRVDLRAASLAGSSEAFVHGAEPPGPSNLPLAELPPLPVPSAPPDGTTNVDFDTVFSAVPAGGGIQVFQFTSTGNRERYFVVTDGSSATIPDLRDLGRGLPAQAGYIWSVSTWGPWASVDEMAAEGALRRGDVPVAWRSITEPLGFVTE